MFTDGQNIEKSYSLNYQCHKLQNITVLKTESKFCFRNKVQMLIFATSQPRDNVCGQIFSWPPGHDLWSDTPGLPGRGDGNAWN